MRFRAPESSTYMLITPALDGIKSYTSVIAQLINPIVFSIKRLTFATKITFFSRNHQENYKKSATRQQITSKSASTITAFSKAMPSLPPPILSVSDGWSFHRKYPLNSVLHISKYNVSPKLFDTDVSREN